MIEPNVLPFKMERTDEKITPHAGLALVHEFHRALGLDRLLDAELPTPGSGRGYRPSEVVLPVVLLLEGGGRDLDDLPRIADDAALCEAAGFDSIPAPTTLGDWLRRTGDSKGGMRGLERVADRVTALRHKEDTREGYTLDVDTTIIAAEKQEATRAYEGTKGFQPMVGFLSETRWCIHDEFRTGSASPQAGGVAFIERCRKRLPKGKRIRELRSDSAFYNHEVTDFCHKEGLGYTIGADWDAAVEAAYGTIPSEAWTPVPATKGEAKREVAETVHTFNQGTHSFRLVFVRDIDPQGQLFGQSRRGRGIITNVPVTERATADVVAWYNQRATMENYLKELKHGFGMDKLPCGQEKANAAWFRIGVLAYNLFLFQQAFALPPEMLTSTVETVRWRLYQVAARWVRHARQRVIKVATDAATFAMLQDFRFASRSWAFP